MPDCVCLCCRLFGPRGRMASRGARADADRHGAYGYSSADRTAAHRHQSAPGLSALRELVCDSISAERPGAVPRETRLVAAGVSLAIPGRAKHEPGIDDHSSSISENLPEAFAIMDSGLAPIQVGYCRLGIAKVPISGIPEIGRRAPE